MTPIPPNEALAGLRAIGVSLLSGVPCSSLAGLSAADGSLLGYIPASIEGEAVALACGAWLAGGLGAAAIQSSGLGNTVNILTSLAMPYAIPVALLVSWRGQPGTSDAYHQQPMGERTLPLLELLDAAPATLEDLDAGLEALRRRLQRRRIASWLIPRGVIAQGAAPEAPAPAPSLRAPRRFPGGAAAHEAILAGVLARSDGAALISPTGHIARRLSAMTTRPEHFPMQGSMGFACALGLGVSLQQPRRRVVVLDGDGALLMRLGVLATVGRHGPRDFIHVVLDNGCYASTGGQPSSGRVDFAAAALASGYARAGTAGAAGLDEALSWAFTGLGPTLLHVDLTRHGPPITARPEAPPPELALRFREAISDVR